jgi:hypothetical protein
MQIQDYFLRGIAGKETGFTQAVKLACVAENTRQRKPLQRRDTLEKIHPLEASGIKPVFPAKLTGRKFSKPVQGTYRVVRFIRSDGILDVFREHFQLPEQAVYEYVTATIDVAQERMVVDMGGTKIGEIVYLLR